MSAWPQTLVAIEVVAGWGPEELAGTLEEALSGAHAELRRSVLVCEDAERSRLEAWLRSRRHPVPMVAYDRHDTATLMHRLLRQAPADYLAWLPAGMRFCPFDTARLLRQGASLSPWLMAADAPEKTARPHPVALCGWIAHREALDLEADWGPPSAWLLKPFLNAPAAAAGMLSWAAAPVCHDEDRVPAAAQGAPPVTSRSSVLVTIPHYRCEPWLAACLRSVLEQTRVPDAVAVLHDGPEPPPTDILKRFPSVSLYRSEERVGPYALIQSLIDRTCFDAVLFQDADDWSSRERLALLLSEAERTGAELVGSQEIRVDEIAGRVHAVCYPRDVSHALSLSPGHPLLHPTSLISIRLLARLGGFATGLRFGADTEMLLRAGFAARIVNIPAGAYFRRHRQGSLTTHPDTGLDSPVRQSLLDKVKAHARENQKLYSQGKPPDLRPLVRRQAVPLVHVAGPALFK